MFLELGIMVGTIMQLTIILPSFFKVLTEISSISSKYFKLIAIEI